MSDDDILREAYGVQGGDSQHHEAEQKLRKAGLWNSSYEGVDVEEIARRLETIAMNIRGFHNWPHKDRLLTFAASLSEGVKERQRADDARCSELWSVMRGAS